MGEESGGSRIAWVRLINACINERRAIKRDCRRHACIDDTRIWWKKKAEALAWIHECYFCDQITFFSFKKIPPYESSGSTPIYQLPLFFLLEKSNRRVAKPTMHMLQGRSMVFEVRRTTLQSRPHEHCKDKRRWCQVRRISFIKLTKCRF